MAAELNDQGAVLLAGCEAGVAVGGRVDELLAVKHGRVGQLGTVPSAQEPERELRLVDHGRNDELGAPDLLEEGPR